MELKHFIRHPSSSEASPPSSDGKLLSTLMKPVAPPQLLSWERPLIRLEMPVSSGTVPTSRSTQNSGLR